MGAFETFRNRQQGSGKVTQEGEDPLSGACMEPVTIVGNWNLIPQEKNLEKQNKAHVL